MELGDWCAKWLSQLHRNKPVWLDTITIYTHVHHVPHAEHAFTDQ